MEGDARSGMAVHEAAVREVVIFLQLARNLHILVNTGDGERAWGHLKGILRKGELVVVDVERCSGMVVDYVGHFAHIGDSGSGYRRAINFTLHETAHNGHRRK